MYQTDVNLEHVIRGNSAVIKCSVPSFVADYVVVDAWLVDQDLVNFHSDVSGTKKILLGPLPLAFHENPFRSKLDMHSINVVCRRFYDELLMIV